MISRYAAAEAMIAAFAILAVKTRRFLAMKWTARPEVAFRRIGLFPIKGNPRTDHIGDRHALPDLIEKGWRKSHRTIRSKIYALLGFTDFARF